MAEAETGAAEPAFLVFDVETVADGELLRKVRYAAEEISSQEAVARARAEALERSQGRSDFVAASFCYPIAICVARVSADFRLLRINCLDAPQYRPREMVRTFWSRLEEYDEPTLVSFNGRGFDLPVLELAAFRFGLTARKHFQGLAARRHRYGAKHLDLNDWLSNYGACPIAGGLDLLSKLLGKPGKMRIAGHDVADLFIAGKIAEINDYCMFDVLDTYFVFLRSRVMVGAIDLETEQQRVAEAHEWIRSQTTSYRHLEQYLQNWGDWQPWV
jgi:predicted PolB exonuclease-like 3'-5' exonuclease